MSRSAITITSAVTNDGAVANSTTFDAGVTGTSGLSISTETKDDKFIVRTVNNSTTGVFVVYSGAMNNKNVGNLEVTVGGSIAKVIGPLEGARFRQSDGDFYFGATYTGAVECIQV